MKTITIIFWAVAALIGAELLLFIQRGLLFVMGEYSDLTRCMWLCKILTYVIIGTMGGILFRIMNTFKQQGYLTQTNVNQLKYFSLIGLGGALLNSLANACMDAWKYFHKPELSFFEARERIFLYLAEHIFDQSLIVYVLILSIMLLAYFAQTALNVKSENESFI